MTIRVDVAELQQCLTLTPPDQNVMLVGRHGIGKSEIISEFYRKRGMPVVAFFLGQMSDPGDLIGLMHQNTESGRSEFLPPYWWPADDQPVVLFLDELNRARPEILQSVMELTLNKTLAGKRLPAGSVIVSAVNEGDEYQLTDLDPALVSRFNLYHFAPTVDDWLNWARQNQVDERILSFISTQPRYLDHANHDDSGTTQMPMDGLSKTPDRRGWARVSHLIESIEEIKEIHVKLIAGIVGPQATNAFRKSLAVRLPVSPEEVFRDFQSCRDKLDSLSLSQTLLLNEQMVIWICANRCPSGHEETAREQWLAYLNSLRERQLDEAVAHLVSLMDQPKFESAMIFATGSMALTDLLTGYMEGLRVE